jgi:hypothetical protein
MNYQKVIVSCGFSGCKSATVISTCSHYWTKIVVPIACFVIREICVNMVVFILNYVSTRSRNIVVDS